MPSKIRQTERERERESQTIAGVPAQHMGVSQNEGSLFGDPHNKDYSKMGVSIGGSLILGN